jgi:Ca2+-binding EF-hand superfamily protein
VGETSRTQGIGPGQTTRKGPFAIKTARGTPILNAKKRKPKPPKAVARTQLVIRAGLDPKSKRVGSLLAGSVFFVLESRPLGDIATRVQVALRDNSKPKGWVTAQRDGEPFLDIVDGELRRSSSSGGGGAAGGGSPGKLGKSKGFISAVDNTDISYTLEELQALRQRQLDSAEEIEQNLDAEGAGLASQLGDTLLNSKLTAKDYLQDFEKADKGVISKSDFRKSVRALVPALGTSSNNEVDALFESWDSDKSGMLDIAELRAAFTRMKEQARERAARVVKRREKAERLRRHAEVTAKAEAATQAAEALEAELKERIERPPVETRLGILLVKRNMKVGDMVAKWDVDHDGALDKKEFLKNVADLGLEASAEELEALYIKIDADGSGQLEVPELVMFMKKNQEMRKMEEEEEKAMTKKAAERRKLAKQAQIAAFREDESDEHQQQKEEEEARIAAEEKAKAELQAAAKAKEAKKLAKKAKKQEKAEIQEKIDQKREEIKKREDDRQKAESPTELAGSTKEAAEVPPAPIDPAIKGKFKSTVEKVLDGDGRVDRHPPPTGPGAAAGAASTGSVAPSGSTPDELRSAPKAVPKTAMQHGLEVQS